MSPGQPKASLRRALLERRKAIAADLRWRLSAQLAGVVARAETWASARAIAAFVGVRGEPDTRPLLKRALTARKALYLPRVVSDTDLDFARVSGLDDLVEAAMGLMEPSPLLTTIPLDAQTVDLILVPGLGFASDGARIGQGRGYYDRLLAGFGDARPPTMGVCFSSFLDPAEGAIPMDEHDVRVDFVATEDGLVDCRR